MSEQATMEDVVDQLKIIAPEIVDAVTMRYQILRTVKFTEPIGRRGLAQALGISERIIRKEANLLKDQGLLGFSIEGMLLSDRGDRMIDALAQFFHHLMGLRTLEERLAAKLQIKRVIIGSASDIKNPSLETKEVAATAARYLSEILTDHEYLGITGGTTVMEVVEAFEADKRSYKDLKVIPARGGLGNKTDFQANTLVEKLADKLGAHYKLLYTRDNLSASSISQLVEEPDIREIIGMINNIDVLLFGVGRADVMARRRNLDEEEVDMIRQKGAVCEAFGHFFNREGKIVHEVSTIGIDLDKFKHLKQLIAVATGREKVEAIIAISKLNPNLVLVTDENVVREILKD